MSRSFRTAEGGRIDRARPLAFRFDGRDFRGCRGDTLASALLANGVRLVGRSFKYHRPRGLLAAGVEEPNALVRVGTGARAEPNTRATQIELHDGLVAASQNAWPGLGFDLGGIADAFSMTLPAGFYYKTFMWPAGAWKFYEKFIRMAAGLGRAPREPDPDIYEKRHLHCDVLVIGAGPAGLAAARAAGGGGARVVLADDQPEPGGSLLASRDLVAGQAGAAWAAEAAAALAELPELRLLSRTTVVSYLDHNYLVALERVNDHLEPERRHGPRHRLWKIRAAQVVLATGALERPLVFADNDRPGVMLAGAARTYLARYGVRPGGRAVVTTNNDSAYRAALDAAEGGVEIAAIVDVRPEPRGALPRLARERGIEVVRGSAVTAVKGARRVAGVDVMALNGDASGVQGRRRAFDCDLVMMSGGWNPTVHLFSQSGGRLDWNARIASFVPGRRVQPCFEAGAVAGSFALADALAEGAAAGAAAAEAAGGRAGSSKAPACEPQPGDGELDLRPVWALPGGRAVAKRFVDFGNDVTADDVALAWRENYGSVEHLKRYTTTGMGTDQGKTSNVNALALLASLRGEPVEALGHTTFRPFYTPVTIGAVAGIDTGSRLLDPVRMTPMHHWHEAHGAHFEDVGQWKRPYCYPRAGESVAEAVTRETFAVRSGVGILDASTLGKIDIQGPDAAELVNRVYTNDFSGLPVGGCRYGLMLKDDGMVFDDGVAARLAERRYLVTTTTGGAAAVLGWLEEWLQCEWPDLEVFCTSVTSQWAAVAVAGPRSRRLVAELTALDLSNEAFPFMTWRDAEVAGIPGRIFRISFSGDLGYEIQTPASYGLALWRALTTAGERYNVTPYGTEAMHVLRAEKGFPIIGQDTDGTTTPHDLGMSWIVSRKKGDFLGRRGLERPDTLRTDRKQLVGLLTEDANDVLPEGAHISPEPHATPPVPMEGWVSSSYYSPNCGRAIALALLKRGRERIGETVALPLADRLARARVVEPVFFDPEGERLRG